RDALESVPEITVLGGLPRNDTLVIPERHLGLVTREEHELTPQAIAQLAAFGEDNLDLERMRLIANVEPSRFKVQRSGSSNVELGMLNVERRSKVRFAVARDEAFCFYYPDNLELLEQAGAELVSFSPLRDSS